jgi:hypothetical protein
MSLETAIDTLERNLSSLTIREEKLDTLQTFFGSTRDLLKGRVASLTTSTDNSTPPDEKERLEQGQRLQRMLHEEDKTDPGFGSAASALWDAATPSDVETVKLLRGLEYFPCANENSATGPFCPRVGKLACGACTFVSYCSTVSPELPLLRIPLFILALSRRIASVRTGLSTRAVGLSEYEPNRRNYCSSSRFTPVADCKDPLRQDGWKSRWVIEGRRPSFVGSGDQGWEQQTKFGLGLHCTFRRLRPLSLTRSKAEFASIN